MGERPLERRLRDFGFSDKEADIYRAVLELGEAKPSEIASAAEVSTRYAYEVGARLEDRGFLTVHDQVTPTTIRARAPEEAIAELTDELADLKPLLRERYDAPGENKLEVEIVKTQMTLRKRLRELIGTADREIAIAIPAAALGDLADELRSARERGVFVLLVVLEPGDHAEIPDLADVTRVHRHAETGILAIDNAVAAVMTVDMITRTNTDDLAFACFDERLARPMIDGFDGKLWLGAEEHAHADPVELPATFLHFKRAVLHATLHGRAGVDVAADVSGHAVDTDDSVTASGRVIQIDQQLVVPVTNAKPGRLSLTLDTGASDLVVGGPDAIDADVRASEICLREV